MLFSRNILKQFIDINDSDQDLANQLILKSCEIEKIKTRAIADTVVFGKVTEVKTHPNADKLFICQVDCGTQGIYRICTAAENIAPNYYVPVALPGTYLPARDITIIKRDMRGVQSNGMICAKEELSIDEDLDIHGIRNMQKSDSPFQKREQEVNLKIGKREQGSFHTPSSGSNLTPEQSDFTDITDQDLGIPITKKYPRLIDTIFDVDNKTLTHRPDLTGHFAMAIELQAIYQTHFPSKVISSHIDEFIKGFSQTNHQTSSNKNNFLISQTDKLRSYTAIHIDQITIHKSPLSIRLALLDLGLQPRNNRVDFGNLFMYITGQPIHIFDADQINQHIIIRQAQDQETFTDLFDKKHTLTPQDILITDQEEILAIAGVIGGKNSGVTDQTTNIIIEIANFDPIAVRKTAIRLATRTDASMRFEKNINPLYTLATSHICSSRIQQEGFFANNIQTPKAQVHNIQHYIPPTTQQALNTPQNILVDREKVSALIENTTSQTGPNHHAQDILQNLGCNIQKNTISLPIRRGPGDLNVFEDIVEEVARIYGYEKINTIGLTKPIQAHHHGKHINIMQHIEDILTKEHHCDMLEIYPRAHDQELKLFGVDQSNLVQMDNSLTPETSFLTDSLLYNLFTSIKKNHKFFDTINLASINNVWTKEDLNTSDQNQNNIFAKLYGDIHKSVNDTGSTIRESRHMAIMLYQRASTHRDDDLLLHAKHIITNIIRQCTGMQAQYQSSTSHYFHPQKQGLIQIEPTDTKQQSPLGFIGQIHPHILSIAKLPESSQLVYAYIDIPALQGFSSEIKKADYTTLQDQIITRDLSFVIDQQQSFDTLLQAIKKTKRVEDYAIFDIYQGKELPSDKKSIAITITIKGDGTLTTEGISQVMDEAILNASNTGATLRKDFNTQS